MSDSRELTARATQLAAFSSRVQLDGLEEPQQFEVARPPLLRIVQPGSLKKGDKRKAGQLVVGNLCLDDPEVVFLKRTYFRELEEGKDKDRRTVCASDDAKFPMGKIASPKSDTCTETTCPYAAWDDDPATGKRVPPKCKLGYAFVGVLPSQDFAPFIFTTKNWEGVDAATELIQGMVTDLTLPRARGIYDYVVKITTEERKNGGLVYYIPKFTAVRRPLEKDDPYRGMFQAVKELVYQPFVIGEDVADEPVEAPAEANGTAGPLDL